MKKLLLIGLKNFVLVIPLISHAQVETLADGGAALEGVVASQQPPYSQNLSGDFNIQMNLGCYGVNLRNPAGTVDFFTNAPLPITVKLRDSTGAARRIVFQIPKSAFLTSNAQGQRANFQVVAAGGRGGGGRVVLSPQPTVADNNAPVASKINYVLSGVGPDISGQADLSNNSLATSLPIVTDTATVSSSGEVDIVRRSLILDGVEIGQGVREDKVRATLASNGRALNLDVIVPSATIGVCGSFVSPLMVFFDKKRPQFNHSVSFALGQPLELKVYWPEAKSEGYFLAYNRDGDDKVKDGSQLFGTYETPNGFESLKTHDSNKDGMINAKDKTFSKLVLWHDKNANGITDKGDELISLSSKGITSISLKYSSDKVIDYGARAQSREYSEFKWLDKKGVEQKGVVEDIWFNTTSNEVRHLASE